MAVGGETFDGLEDPLGAARLGRPLTIDFVKQVEDAPALRGDNRNRFHASQANA